MASSSSSSHPQRVDYPDGETDLTKVDPNIAQKVILKYGLKCVAYKNEFWLDMWPRLPPNGFLIHAGFKEIDIDIGEWCDQWKRFQARQDDIFISSFPKSGHHWMFEVVYMLINGKTRSQNRLKILNYCEVRTNEELEEMPSPRILLTHLKYQQMPEDVFNKGCKIIYIYRNPKDVTASYYHHVKKIDAFNFRGDWHQYFELTMSGLHHYGKWLDNVPEWWKHGNGNRNIFFLSYEQIKKNFAVSAKRIAGFLGKSYSEDFYRDLEKACSIESMRANADNLDESPKRGDVKTPGLVRRGVVGDWKTHFTVAENEQFDAMYQPVLDQFPHFPVEYE